MSFHRGAPDKSPFNYNRTDVFGLNLNSWFDWIWDAQPSEPNSATKTL